jgi:hypothetical protein
MIDPRSVKRDMLLGIVDLRLPEAELDFEIARNAAERLAQERLANPMLLAWFDRRAWRHSPSVC